MSDWAATLVSGVIGIAGVGIGAVLQAQQERARDRRQRLFVPAAEMAAKLRGAATSLDYVIDGIVSGDQLESDAFQKAKHYVWEAHSNRAGVEFAFPQSSGVFAKATDAVQRLKDAYDVAARARAGTLPSPVEGQLVDARRAYDSAIDSFVAAAQAASRRRG
jgi:hypothetical protein